MYYRITPVNPLISRDARPFGAGSRVRSLEWITQTSTAGAIRSEIWRNMSTPDSDAVLSVKVMGAFPIYDGKIYFPRPLDAIADKLNVYQISPCDNLPEGCYAHMPIEGLIPAFPDTLNDFKPEKINPWWRKNIMSRWLKQGSKNFVEWLIKNANCPASEWLSVLAGNSNPGALTLESPAKDERTHVSIDSATGTAKEGMLFSTTGLDFTRRTSRLERGTLSVKIDMPDNLAQYLPEKFIAPFGGERRLAEFTRCDSDSSLWESPQGLATGNLIRMILATPAIFAQGWLPGWIDARSLEGTIPGTNVRVKLISAVNGRWQAVSGWSYDSRNYGPKPVRRAVPAGSVYFFEVIDGNFDAGNFWLKSVCDDVKDIHDGFGLAMWGNYHLTDRKPLALAMGINGLI